MKSTADIAAKAADAILARVEQTHPRALHRDMLIDEITRALKETRQAQTRSAGELEGELRAHLDAMTRTRGGYEWERWRARMRGEPDPGSEPAAGSHVHRRTTR
jgi:hypothetical protein